MFAELERVRRLSDQVREITGHTAYLYTTHQAASVRPRIVFADVTIGDAAEAALYMEKMLFDVQRGDWSEWNCRSCGWQYRREDERDAHEVRLHAARLAP